jgi:outer membrane protein OmpA-like peptidoglycan-associated protein
LVLKHHKRTIIQEIQQYFKIRQHYDELTALEKDYYIPLDYYYQLVEFRKEVDTLRPPKSVLLNMGETVNSKKVPGYAPAISANDKFMLFTKRTVDNRHIGANLLYNENLYFSKNYDGFWDEAEPFPHPIQSTCNEGSATLSSDGKTLYFTRCRVQINNIDCYDCLGRCDIYVSEKDTAGNWAKPKNMGPGINSEFWESHPFLSQTDDTLYFVSDKPGGFGLTDIYFIYKVTEHRWSQPINMGPVVNTRGAEYSPFVSRNHNVFYFSSTGHILNFGDLENKKKSRSLDIYKSEFERGVYKDPKNVGPLVNGEGDESYFTMDSKASNLFYAKTEEGYAGGNDNVTDIFSFPVPMGAQPTANVTLKGTLYDEETGDTYEGIVSIIDLENGIEVAPKEVRENGTFEFDLIDHNKYLLVIQGDEFFRIEKLFEMKGDTTIENKATSVRNRKLQFSSIVFENGKAEILPEMEDDLKDVIDFLVDNPAFNLKIGGHTDTDGDPKLNRQLSQSRADAIKKYIVEKGYIAPERIVATGYGSSNPLRFPEETEKDKAINRRVEFEIYYDESKKVFSHDDFNQNNNTDDDGDAGW